MDGEKGFTGSAWHIEYEPYYKAGGRGHGGWLGGDIYWDRDEAAVAFAHPDKATVRVVLADARRDGGAIGYVVLSLVEDTYEDGEQVNAVDIERVRYPVGLRTNPDGTKSPIVFWSRAVEI